MCYNIDWITIELSDINQYTLSDQGCLPTDYSPRVSYNFYVEVTLDGCKYLCQRLHDITCTQIVFLPVQRSCYLQPDQDVPLQENMKGCSDAMIYKRKRDTGKFAFSNKWHSDVCSKTSV